MRLQSVRRAGQQTRPDVRSLRIGDASLLGTTSQGKKPLSWPGTLKLHHQSRFLHGVHALHGSAAPSPAPALDDT
jgi:hypothetical protein